MPSDSPSPEDTLAALRAQIDDVDSRLLEALAERSLLSKAVGEAKRGANPDSGGDPVHRPGREAQLIRSLLDRYQGPMDRRAIHAMWRELIGSSIAIQKPLTVATADSAAEQVARLHFGASQDYIWAAEPLVSVSSGDADIALFEAANVEGWQKAAELLDERDDCALLWRLPFIVSAGGWVAVGRGIAGDSGIDQTLFYTADLTLADHPAVETILATPDSGAVLALAGAYDEAMLPAALGLDNPEAVQRLGQWPVPLEI